MKPRTSHDLWVLRACLALCIALGVAASVSRAADAPAATDRAASRDAAEIDALLARVAQARDVVFIRNGSEHSAGEAAAHLRRKLRAAHGRVRTADQLIDFLGTRSSLTGIAYRVRLADGREMPSAQWLRGLLHAIRAGQARTLSIPAQPATPANAPVRAGR
jgi:hypothetical protein